MSDRDPSVSMLTCPLCKATKLMRIPTIGYRRWWRCPACRESIAVGDDQCCIFCVYGDMPCATGQAYTTAKAALSV